MTILGVIPLDMDTVVANLLDTGPGNVSIIAAAGRTGGNGLRIANNTVVKSLGANLGTLNIAFGFNPLALGNVLGPIQYLDAGSLQCNLRILSDGTVVVYRNNVTLLTSSSVGAVSIGVYQHIEFAAVIAATGSVQVWVNSVSVVSSSANTKQTANSTVSQITFGTGAAGNNDFSDIIWADARIGDRRVDVRMPTGSGFYTQFTPSGSNANWQNIKEVPSDGDASYNTSSVAGNIDTFSHATMSFNPLSIDAVIVQLRARNTTIGAGNIAPVLRSGTTDISGSDVALGTSYQNVQIIYPLDPATSASWASVAAVNAAQPGYKKTV